MIVLEETEEKAIELIKKLSKERLEEVIKLEESTDITDVQSLIDHIEYSDVCYVLDTLINVGIDEIKMNDCDCGYCDHEFYEKVFILKAPDWTVRCPNCDEKIWWR